MLPDVSGWKKGASVPMTKHGKAGPVVSPQELTAEASYAEILKICEFANGLKFEQLC